MARRLAVAPVLALLVWGCGGRATVPVASDPVPPPPRSAERVDVPPAPPAPERPAAVEVVGPPAPIGVHHVLLPGQTLYTLARLYDVPLTTLVKANGIADPAAIPAGTPIFIPGVRRTLPYPAPHAGADRQEAAVLPAPATHHQEIALQWPLNGRVTSPYGERSRGRYHTGIDIDGRKGDLIHAAASGVVIEAGVDGLYGQRIVVDHGDGLTTLYAHASRLLVHAGDRVRTGQRIAEVGRSGNAHGTHLHFEVRHDGRTVDPVPILGSEGPITAESH